MFDERGMKRLSVQRKEKLDGVAGISLSSVLSEHWVSHMRQLNQQAVRAAHYQTMETFRVDT